eukprot:8255364-Alexandrium_andersonii.AAC.1
MSARASSAPKQGDACSRGVLYSCARRFAHLIGSVCCGADRVAEQPNLWWHCWHGQVSANLFRLTGPVPPTSA